MQRRNSDRSIAPTQGFRLPRWKLVAFIEHQNPWNPIEGKALQHGLDRRDMGIQIFRPSIDHVQEEIGIAHFVQCRSEGCKEIFWQVANKSHRVGDDDLTAMWKIQSTARGIERFKHAWSRAHLTFR